MPLNEKNKIELELYYIECFYQTKDYLMRNKQNGVWKWNRNLYTLIKYNTRQRREEGNHC